MTDQGEKLAAAKAAADKARLAKIFGDVLPDTTSDERGAGGDDASSDDWLRGQVPPHHG